MIPAYQALLFGTFGASFYMMTRILLVSALCARCYHATNCSDRDTRRGMARTRCGLGWNHQPWAAVCKQSIPQQSLFYLARIVNLNNCWPAISN
jgi:hypothetical protein